MVESFIDELANAGRRDPVELRRALLANQPRHLAVLNAAVEKAGWGKRVPRGHGRGVAVHRSYGSVVAQVADVRVEGDSVLIDRAVCAIDCGLAINPAQVAAQMESGIAFGLSAALNGQITIENGQVQQSNFNDYAVLRFDEMPTVDTIIVSTGHTVIGGVGEVGVPPIAPAICNAIFAATGKRVRKLPIKPFI